MAQFWVGDGVLDAVESTLDAMSSSPSRRARRATAVIGLLACAVLGLGGCSHAEDANAVDQARLLELHSDPWLDPDSYSEVARYAFGSNLGYRPGTTTSERTLEGTAAAALLAELAAAHSAGWEPISARCARLLGETAGVEPKPVQPQALAVHLARTLADRSLAEADVYAWVDPSGAAGENGASVLVNATVPHHLQAQPAGRTVIDPTTLPCLAAGAATDAGAGQSLGDPSPLNTTGKQTSKGTS